MSDLTDQIVNAIWEGFDAEDNACTDRRLSLIDTGGTYETFSMERIAEHVINALELTEETHDHAPVWTDTLDEDRNQIMDDRMIIARPKRHIVWTPMRRYTTPWVPTGPGITGEELSTRLNPESPPEPT